jgi:hypothetical protein
LNPSPLPSASTKAAATASPSPSQESSPQNTHVESTLSCPSQPLPDSEVFAKNNAPYACPQLFTKIVPIGMIIKSQDLIPFVLFPDKKRQGDFLSEFDVLRHPGYPKNATPD